MKKLLKKIWRFILGFIKENPLESLCLSFITIFILTIYLMRNPILGINFVTLCENCLIAVFLISLLGIVITGFIITGKAFNKAQDEFKPKDY